MKKRISLIFLFVFMFSVSVFAQSQTYTVKSGDTMWKIASKFQVGTSEIISANPQVKNPALIYPGQKLAIPSVTVKTQENEVIRLVNAERAKAGLQPLTQNWQLSRVARYKSQDMIDKGYFSHTSPTYGSPFKMMESFGIRYSAAGENIAMGQQSPTEVMNAWMNSPGHRNNILSPSFTQIGVGLAKDKNGRMYWTQMFIKPL
ncbi:SafA/ExsA family spore coat assembly protein [Acetivibrio cellulolyticus]|uniref:SafA/ExsA family spore coat assembly protein n=1 Tax=Acetivibrio cellulolyticus TaxID=35830 RepID=UPI0001E2CBAF|nr:SafA/ExsA family spore coat assembly protein [Acetivibrio cellulolyticus]